MKKIIVTGAAGFIGSNLVDKLIENGHKVIGIDNFNDYYNPDFKKDNIKKALESNSFQIHHADICSKDEISTIVKNSKAEIIIHLAARAGVRPSIDHPQIYLDTNVGGTLNLLEAIRTSSVSNFIFASSSSVYGQRSKMPFTETDSTIRPVSPYAATKITAEKMLQTWRQLHSFNATILRFFTVYGPKGRPDMAPYLFTKNILKGTPIVRYGNGSSSRDYTYVDDIVLGILAAVDKSIKFEIINLGNSQPATLNNLISTIEKATGKKAKVETRPKQKGDVEKTFASIKKAKEILGWTPTTSLETGMIKFVDWFLQNRQV